MAKRTAMQNLARWHIWLGWAVGVPVLLWLATGLLMVARPIEDVRGDHLRRPPVAIDGTALVVPAAIGKVAKMALLDQLGQPVWVVTREDKSVARYSARDGRPLAVVAPSEARALAEQVFAGEARFASVRRFEADQAPLELRRPRPSWQVRFADDTRIYLDADSGEVLALRTRWWRIFDVAWGLHIMDLQTREDTSNAWLWTFGGGALVSGLFGTVLLFRRRRKAR